MFLHVRQASVYFLEQMMSADKYPKNFASAEGYFLFIKYYRLTILHRPRQVDFLPGHATLSFFQALCSFYDSLRYMSSSLKSVLVFFW